MWSTILSINFCVVDMSTFYLDVVKDCLYTEKPDSHLRRSVQTVLYHIVDTLVRLLTPVLTFTAEEIYRYMPKSADAPVSVQLLDMIKADPTIQDSALEEKWLQILAIREVVSHNLETARQDKLIGHSLDAAVELFPNQEEYELLSSIKDILSKIFIVSQVVLQQPQANRADDGEILVKVAPATGHKCSRCWVYSESVGNDSDHPELCTRCADVLK